MNLKQVKKTHYSFKKYFHLRRWQSLWHQLDEILACSPNRILEIGPGVGILKNILKCFEVTVETVDLDSDLAPDYILSVLDLPFDDESYDCVCAFQMLEHIPFHESLRAFGEMVRVSKKYIIISLPDAQPMWTFEINLPLIGRHIIQTKNLFRLKNKIHQFDGQHYWEVNKKGYSLFKILDEFSKFDVTLEKTYRVERNLYHRFFVFKKNNIRPVNNNI
jgi:SAM-dependent methyltransferase